MTRTALVSCFAMVLLTIVLAGWIMLEHGTGDIGTREALRGTARLAFVPFVLCFIARPLHDLHSNTVSACLLANRKLLGVAFGLSISVHLWLIFRLFYLSAPNIPEVVTLADIAIGGPGLFLVAVMLVTTIERPRAAIDPVWWDRIHTFGQYLVWFIFLACLTDSHGRKSPPYPASDYVPFIAILIAAMAIRLGAVWLRRRGHFRQVSG